jgi:hypothetical protein
MDSFSIRIQIISIIVSAAFLFFTGRLIVKGKLRAEYAIFWVFVTALLLFFSIWRDGLEFFSNLLGVHEAPNLVFLVAIFAVFVYLLHLSIVASKNKENTKKMAQEIAFLKQLVMELKAREKDHSE